MLLNAPAAAPCPPFVDALFRIATPAHTDSYHGLPGNRSLERSLAPDSFWHLRLLMRTIKLPTRRHLPASRLNLPWHSDRKLAYSPRAKLVFHDS